MGISRSAISKKARELGLVKAEKSEKSMKIEGFTRQNFGKMTCAAIAKKTGVSARTIYRTVKRLGLTLPQADKSRLMSGAMEEAFDREWLFRSVHLSPEMRRQLGSDKSRRNIEYRLAADGYFVTRFCDIVYYLPSLKRHPIREKHAEEMGMVFLEYPEEYLLKKDNEGAYAPENFINSSFMLITGIIKEVSEKRSGTSKKGDWVAQDYVLETEEQNPQQCLLTAWGDNIAKFNIQVGERVTVEFTMYAKKSDTTHHWFGSNRVVNVTRV